MGNKNIDINLNNVDNIENINPNEINKEQIRLISTGKYSEILQTKNNKNENIALKIITKNDILKMSNDINQENLDDYIQNKISLMKKINSLTSNSIAIFSNLKKENKFIIELEFCENNLRQYLNKYYKEKAMTLDEIKNLFNNLNSVFIIMEENGIFHGDIKPEHILIEENKEKNINPKLIDYFCFYTFSKKYSLYNSPEILLGNHNQKDEMNIKIDLWSIGLIMYELHFKCLPFNNIEELLEIIKERKKLNLLKSEDNSDFNDLIEKLLKINIEERISFKDYINHNFWKSKQSQNKENKLITIKNVVNIDKKEEKNDNKTNFYNSLSKEYIFKFNSENYEKELNEFPKENLQNIEIFKFSGFNSKKSYLTDEIIFQFLKKLNLKNLKKLFLDNNDIANIKGLSQLILENLTHLFLNNNKINDIEELNQAKFEKLLLLDLSQNELINLNSFSKVQFKNLSILNLSENKINDISFLKNLHLNSLKILNFGFNQIKNIDILSQVQLINLKSLYLNSNQIENIEVFNSVLFKKLEILNLANNDIINITSLKKLNSLKKLDLGFNKIDNIEIIKSSVFDNLESLNISFNKLNNIDCFSELKLKSIKKISFYGNDFINQDSLVDKEIIKNLKNKHIIIF